MLEPYLEKAVSEIKKRKPKLVAVQAPEGMKTRLPGLLEEIEKKTGTKAFAFIEPCFGACGIKDTASKELGADLLIHIGHSRFTAREAIETAYIPLEYRPDRKSVSGPAEELGRQLKQKGFKKIALCSTIQFSQHLKLFQTEMEKKGFAVYVGKGKNMQEGQVLGCNYTSVKAVEKKAEAIAFLGDGLFHAIGLSFACSKPVYLVDPIQKEVQELSTQKDLFLRKRIAMVEKARQAKNIAIWVSTKKGQQRMQPANSLKKKFEKQGKKVFVFASNLIDPNYIAGLDIGAIVCTACPRIALDDSSSFRQPVINTEEARILLGEKSIKEYSFDEIC